MRTGHHKRRAAAGAGGGGGGLVGGTVAFDCTNSYEQPNFMGLRSVEFYLVDVLIDLVYTTDFLAYATTFIGAGSEPENVFETGLSKTGSWVDTAWLSDNGDITNQRLQINFVVPTPYDKIVVNNSHNSGGLNDTGVKDLIIYNSPTAQALGAYGDALTSGTKIFDSTLAIHSTTDQIEDQILTLI